MDLAGFDAQLDKFDREVKAQAKALVLHVTYEVGKAILGFTPVDTGKLRSNWLGALDAPNVQERESISPGKKGSTAAIVAGAALNEIQTAVLPYRLGQTVYLHNTVDYGVWLNEGTSRIAPRAFLEQGVAAGMAIASTTPPNRIAPDTL